ncbi:efflux RND transporter periplasmic adaptor subunit [Duganella sp.]|uniref:efflux RND transporter periplasmic adaptor subunit n=1 Tax=Duganella sp. TaxID=1904440 RepID=UPI0031D498C3
MDLRYWPLMAAALALAACSGHAEHTAAEQPPPVVTVLPVEPSPVTLNDELPGRVAAYRSADIRPQVGGIVRRRLFDQGAEVRAGQKLFQLDPAPLQAEFDAAAASLQHALATLARAERQAERLQPLIGADAISRQTYDDAVSERDLAAASVAQARAALERKRLDLAFATVQAPISGRIGQELVSEGALVGQTDANPMARIMQIDKVYVDVRQPASMLASPHALRAAASQTVVILSPDGQPYQAAAKLLFTDLNVDAGTGDTIIRILVDNKDRKLLPGMFVRARITRADPDQALLVPQQAVQRRADGNATVWTLDKTGKASQREVAVGEVINHQYLVRSGLRAGETVVVEGQERLQEGLHAQQHLWKPQASTAQR